MNQATLALDLPVADAADRCGFEIGWDHARHGLVPPPALLHAGTPVCQGWMAGRAVFGGRVLATRRTTRLWLALRLRAWRDGIAFEHDQVTPDHLAQIHAAACPVLRLTLGGPECDPAAAVVERLNPQAAFAAGNLAVLSRQAASACAGVDVLEAVRRARQAASGGEAVAGLDAGSWWRLAALRSYATPLPHAEAARLPLAVLPPRRVRLLNAAQGLQALLTMQFLAPGWSARTRAIAALLPEAAQRHDFNLFIGALAARALEAGADPRRLRHALEDAWLQDRVQRRWQQLALGLGAAGTEALLDRTTARGLAAVRAAALAAG